MAGTFPTTPFSGPHSKRGHDRSWLCDTHNKAIAFWCQNHKIAICDLCAFKEHQKPCSVRDIGDKIMDLSKELHEKIENINEAKVTLRDFKSKVDECKTQSDEHMNTVRASVLTRCDIEMKAIDENQRVKMGAINKKAEEEIRKIKQRREEEIKQSEEEAEQQRASLRDLRGKLLGDVDRIAAKLSQYIDQLKKKSTATSHYIEDSEEHNRRLQKSDSELVNVAAPVFEALDETLQGIKNEKDIACAERAVRAVRKVMCSVSNVNGTVRGRIDTGEWERVDTISPDLGGWVVGSVSDNEIGVRRIVDVRLSNVLSIIDVNTHQETARIIDEKGSAITSCAAVSSELIVCGKVGDGCEGDHLTGCVSLYDRRGQPVRDITIPSLATDNYVCVYVDVDGDGMVVAAERDQPHIYVLNPSDGAIVRSVTLPGERKVNHRISSLRDSSGDVVVCTAGRDVYSIVSRSGAVKTTMRDDAWEYARCSVDMVTGALYVAYYDATRVVYRVDRCTSEGVIAERGVVEYPGKDRWWCGVAITPTGKLVVSDSEGRIFIYKQSFNLTQP